MVLEKRQLVPLPTQLYICFSSMLRLCLGMQLTSCMCASWTCSKGGDLGKLPIFAAPLRTFLSETGAFLNVRVWQWRAQWCWAQFGVPALFVLRQQQMLCTISAHVLREQKANDIWHFSENNFQLADSLEGSWWPQESTDHTWRRAVPIHMEQQHRGAENSCSRLIRATLQGGSHLC